MAIISKKEQEYNAYHMRDSRINRKENNHFLLIPMLLTISFICFYYL